MIDKSIDESLRSKRAIFLSATKTKKSTVNTIITTFAPVDNAYSRGIGSIVTLDDLFV